MDCSPPGSSVHGISQARILERIAISFSGGSFLPRDQTHVSCIGQFSSVTQSCPTLCDPMNCSTPDLPVHHQLPESTQTHVHWVGDAIQPSHPLSSPSPPALNLSQNPGLFKWVSSSHQVAKVLEFQLQHQSFQWIPRTDLLWEGLVGSPCGRQVLNHWVTKEDPSHDPEPYLFKSSFPHFLLFSNFILSGWSPSLSLSSSLSLSQPQHHRSPRTMLSKLKLCLWRVGEWEKLKEQGQDYISWMKKHK